MRTRTIPTIAIAELLALSGCSGSDEAEQPATEDAQGAETVDQSEQASDESEDADDGSEDAEDADDESETAEASETADETEDSKLTLDTGEKTVTIEPTDASCSGEPASLRHITAKTNNELPLVKAKGSRPEDTPTRRPCALDDGSEDAEDADDESETAEASETADETEDSKLTLDTGEKTVTIEPTDVYCSGEPGSLRHIIGKTNNELPLVKAEGS